MKRSRLLFAIIGIVILLGIGISLIAFSSARPPTANVFDGNRAFQDVKVQLGFGARVPGSQAHAQAVQWMVNTLKQAGWAVEIQDAQLMGHPIQNVIAKKGDAAARPWIILGAHYDSRMFADEDPIPANRTKPVPGADDGASGVAVLLEIARVLKFDPAQEQVWLVFFDAEDQGDISGWDWTLGAQAFVNQLKGRPDAVVVVDMIGDKDLNIYKEKNSNVALTDAIWQVAASLGYQQQFIPAYKYSMEDDHTPFLAKGLPAIDIIDFDYPYWHTVSDTADKVAPASLKTVGDTLIKWLIAQ